MALAEVLHKLGAGRSKAGEPINHRVGAELLVSLGQKVQKGERSAMMMTSLGSPGGILDELGFVSGAPWMRLHYENPPPSPDQISRLQNALKLGTPDDKWTKTLVEELLLP